MATQFPALQLAEQVHALLSRGHGEGGRRGQRFSALPKTGGQHLPHALPYGHDNQLNVGIGVRRG